VTGARVFEPDATQSCVNSKPARVPSCRTVILIVICVRFLDKANCWLPWGGVAFVYCLQAAGRQLRHADASGCLLKRPKNLLC
jgi:hypothetical protein